MSVIVNDGVSISCGMAKSPENGDEEFHIYFRSKFYQDLVESEYYEYNMSVVAQAAHKASGKWLAVKIRRGVFGKTSWKYKTMSADYDPSKRAKDYWK